MIVLVAAFVLFIFINIAVFLRCCRFSVKKDLHINTFTTPKDIIALTGKIQTTSVFCQSLSLLYLIEVRQVIFLNKLLYSDNCILWTLACRHGVQYEILGLASKYGLNTVQNSKSVVKDAIWTCFKHEVHF